MTIAIGAWRVHAAAAITVVDSPLKVFDALRKKMKAYLSIRLISLSPAPPAPHIMRAAYRICTVDRAGTPPPKAENGDAASGRSRHEESTGPMTRRRKKADATAASD